MRSLTTAFGAMLLGLFAACQERPPAAPDIDTSFELLDESGNVVTHEDFADRLRLVFFGYTYCPDICPITLHNTATALRSLGPLAEDITVLFISIDPGRDTPEVLTRYTESFHASVIGLTGSYEQLVDVTTGFRTGFGYTAASGGAVLSREEYDSTTASDAYVPFHSSQLYLIGRDNNLLEVIGYGSKPPQIAAKLRAHVDD